MFQFENETERLKRMIDFIAGTVQPYIASEQT
jgi:hypothetical protein